MNLEANVDPVTVGDQKQTAAITSVRRPPPEHVTQVKVARIGLIGGLLAALIAGLLGGVIAGLFAFSNTAKQLTGESKRSRAEFLRAQRVPLYSEVLTHEQALQDAEEEYLRDLEDLDYFEAESILDAVETAQETGSPIFDVRLRPMYDAYAVLARDRMTMTVLGSERIRKSLQGMLDAHRSKRNELLKLTKVKRDHVLIASDYDGFEAAQKAAAEFRESFVEQARTEMGSDGP